MEKVYDYIFIGWGVASSALFLEMCQNPHFNDSTVLILDPQRDHPNQTWSFRADPKTIDVFDTPMHTRSSSYVRSGDTKVHSTYTHIKYCQIRSSDRRTSVDQAMHASCIHIIRTTESVTGRSHTPSGVIVHTNESSYCGKKIFNASLGLNFTPRLRDISFSQKFVGHTIQTQDTMFDPHIATLMDFQKDGDEICFVYVLPHSETTALIEYTYFTDSVSVDLAYIQQKLATYLEKYGTYTLLGKESGSIPMTSHQCSLQDNAIWHIGTAGGCTKPSSGYTFLNILRDSKALVHALHYQKKTRPRTISSRHRRYDSIMLYLMKHRPQDYPTYIIALFAHTPAQALISFMNETSTIKHELSIIYALPKIPFIKALFAVTLRTWKLKIQSLGIISSSSG